MPSADLAVTLTGKKVPAGTRVPHNGMRERIRAMSEELEVLKEVTQRLDRAKIAYMVTGSIATNFYTVPRMTRDIDIVVELSEEHLSRFIRLFETDYYLDPETVRDAVKNRGMFNLIQNEYVIKIDFVVRKDSPYRRREFFRRKKLSVDGQDLYLVAAEDLILSKLVWAKDSRSELQLSDVRNLLKSVKRLNRRYLARWAKELGVQSLYREVSK
jgi:hypothetical protein